MKYWEKIKHWLRENRVILLVAIGYGGLYYLHSLITIFPPREGWFFWQRFVMGVIGLVHAIPIFISFVAYSIDNSSNWGPYTSSEILGNGILIASLGFVILYGLKRIWGKRITRTLLIISVAMLQLLGVLISGLGSYFVGREVICEQFSSDQKGVRLIGYEHYIFFGGASFFKMETIDGGTTWEQVSYEYYDDIRPRDFVDDVTDACEIST